MPPLAPADALAALKWRYAVKKFDPAKLIPADAWAVLEQALVLSPSSTGLQPWRFVVVTDPEVRTKLHPAAYNQSQILDASHLVVFCGAAPPTAAHADRHVARTAAVRDVGPETLAGFAKMVKGAAGRPPEEGTAWAARQCYIALGVFLTTAAMIGVDACPMEGFEPAAFDEILGLKAKGYGSICLAAAGYRHPDDKYAGLPKVRFPADEVIERV